MELQLILRGLVIASDMLIAMWPVAIVLFGFFLLMRYLVSIWFEALGIIRHRQEIRRMIADEENAKTRRLAAEWADRFPEWKEFSYDALILNLPDTNDELFQEALFAALQRTAPVTNEAPQTNRVLSQGLARI